jgi:hypothetical protein
VAISRITANVCFILAENDEMENCNKQMQYEVFAQATGAASASRIVEVPCQMGGHAGVMDSLGLIGHYETWCGMVDEVVAFLREALPERPTG